MCEVEPNLLQRCASAEEETAQNAMVVGTGQGPGRHGAGGKTPKVQLSVSLLGGQTKTRGGWVLERASKTSAGSTTKTVRTTRRAWTSGRTFTGAGGRHRLSDTANPRGRDDDRQHDWATSTASGGGKRRGGQVGATSDHEGPRGRKL